MRRFSSTKEHWPDYSVLITPTPLSDGATGLLVMGSMYPQGDNKDPETCRQRP